MQNVGDTSFCLIYDVCRQLIADMFNSVLMGSLEVPSQSADVIKVPTSQYEFGANFLDPKVCSRHI